MNEIQKTHTLAQDSSIKSITLLQQSMGMFLEQCDVAPSSRQTYKRSLNRFFAWAIKACAKEATMQREHIVKYKAAIDESGLRPFTRALYLVAVRRFFEWAESILLYPNIAKSIKGIRRTTKNHHKDSLSIDTLEKLLNSIDRSTLQGKRDFTLIFLLVHTGLRLIEICRALVSDIEIRDEQALLWVRGKGCEGKDAFVVLNESVLEILEDYLKSRKIALNSKKPLFVSLSDRNYNKTLTTFSLSRIVKERMIAAKIKTSRLTAHSLRHTFGVLAIKSGASLYDVQLAMRHLSPQTTQVYLGDIEKEKRMEGLPEKGVADALRGKFK